MLTEALLLEQNRRLREENEELLETVRQLRARAENAALPEGLPRFSPQQERVVRLLLFKAQPVSRDAVLRSLDDSNRPQPKGVDVIIHAIRGKLDGTQFRLRNRHGYGWWIEHDIDEGKMAA